MCTVQCLPWLLFDMAALMALLAALQVEVVQKERCVGIIPHTPAMYEVRSTGMEGQRLVAQR